MFSKTKTDSTSDEPSRASVAPITATMDERLTEFHYVENFQGKGPRVIALVGPNGPM